MLHSIAEWLLFAVMLTGSLGGLVYLVRLMLWHEKRIEVHHRYMQVPVYYGMSDEREGRGRAGDMAHFDGYDTDEPKERA